MNVEIEEHIRKNVQWAQLPSHIKQVGVCRHCIAPYQKVNKHSCRYVTHVYFQVLENSSKEYDKFVISFSIKNQLRYRGNLGTDITVSLDYTIIFNCFQFATF